jgi:two-component system sensor kinase FixL
MANKERNTSERYYIIWIGLLVGLGFYLADIIIDVFVFRTGTFIEELLNPTHHEIWMRVCMLLLAVSFAIYIQIILKREHAKSERATLAEKFLSSVVDNIPSMVFIKDAGELRFIRVNHTGERLLGLTTPELIGKDDYDFFPESQAEFFVRKDREILASGGVLDIREEDIDTATLGKRWLHTRKVPILDDTGEAIYLLGISDDITEAKRAEAEQKETEVRFQTLFNSAADYIFVIDPEARVIEVNRHACEHSGYDRNEIIGEHINTFFNEESRNLCDSDLQNLKKQGYNLANFEFVCKDGRVLQMECMASAVPDEYGSFKTFMVTLRDITDKKQAEEELQQQQREISHIMRLSTMGEMASGVAHELNQPLTALISYCGTASKLVNSLPSLSPQLGEILVRAEKQAHRASLIIKHLREFIGREHDHKEPLDLDQIIVNMNDLLMSELKHGHITIEHRAGTHGSKVLANKVLIEQVLVNLVLNSLDAIKNSKNSTGNIVVETRLLPDEKIETSVIDNGPGIDADMVGRIFDPFQTSKTSGLGMGLSISRTIIEDHGGKIWADEQHRGGAIFSFNLPVAHDR